MRPSAAGGGADKDAVSMLSKELFNQMLTASAPKVAATLEVRRKPSRHHPPSALFGLSAPRHCSRTSAGWGCTFALWTARRSSNCQ
jgi:hypothetical protein